VSPVASGAAAQNASTLPSRGVGAAEVGSSDRDMIQSFLRAVGDSTFDVRYGCWPGSSVPVRRDLCLWDPSSPKASVEFAMRNTGIGWPAGRWALLAGLIGYATLHRLGQTYGSTSHERRVPMPGDDSVAKPQFVITHGITIDAPPETVWPWLVQMGWHRGGWYTARWVDKLMFPGNRESADYVMEDFQDLQVGDFIPDGAPETECGFVVEQVDPPRLLVLHSTSHLPLQWRRSGRASVDWTWVFSVRTIDSGRRSRLIFRWRAATKPWWLTLSAWVMIVPADFIMSRDMLRGVKRRAERLALIGT
jgi:hypothetical protein